MDDLTRADVIRKAYDIIERPVEVREIEYNREYYEELRASYKKAEPQPRWPALDTARGQSARDEYVDGRARLCIGTAFGLHEDMLPSLACKEGLLKDVHASVIAHQRREMHEHVRAAMEELRCELAAAYAELKMMKGGAAPTIRAWVCDRENYKAIPILSDGRPGAPLDLHPFLQQFLNDTGQR